MATNMDKLKERLQSDGWSLTDDSLQQISNISAHDYREIISNALNNDLRDISEATLAAHISKQRINQLVLQIQKIKNVSAPRSNEDSQVAPRMLKLTLTDGHSTCQAIEVDHLTDLSAHKTAPGTKLLVIGARMQGGYVLLEGSRCRLLGGRVQGLYEKWELGKQMLKQSRSNRTDGPPTWVNFGQKIAKISEVSDFKSLTDKSKETSKESTEFNAQRQDAIAEAATGAVKKVFGKGKQENVANKYNVQNDRQNADLSRRNTKQTRRTRKDDDIDDKVSAKPSDKLSLFAFLEDKLPEQLNPPINANKHHEKTTYQDNAPKSYAMRQNGDCSTAQGRRYKPEHSHDSHKYANSQSNNKYSNFDTKSSNFDTKSSNFDTKSRNFDTKSSNFDTKSSNYRVIPSNSEYKSSSTEYKPSSSEDKSSNNESGRKIERRRNVSSKGQEVTGLTGDVSRLNVNQQFVSRSLQSHLNLSRGNDFKGNQSFYNKDTYGNPFATKHNTTDKKPTAIPPKTPHTYEMAPLDDFGGPKLPTHNAPTKNRTNNTHNSSDAQQNGGALCAWHVGDYCMAKYWEDGRYYNATVTAVTANTCVVQFNEYGNVEEVLNVDCIPFSTDADLSGLVAQKPRSRRIRYFNRSKE